MKKKQILILGPGLGQAGGISTVTTEIYHSWLSEKYDIQVLNTYGNPKILYFLKKLLKYCLASQKKVSLVHVNLASNGSFFRKFWFVLFTRKKIPIVIHLHGGQFIDFYKSSNQLVAKMIDYVFKKSNKIIIVSNYYRPLLIEELNIDGSKIKLIYNGIKMPELNEDTKPKRSKRVLFLGKLTVEKGIDDFLEVVKKIHSIDPEIEFVLGGNTSNDGIYKKVQIFEQKYNLKYLGWLDETEKENIFLNCDILLAPTYFESFGISVLEAMSHGLAIVTYPSGGIPELVVSNRNGYIVNYGDTDEIISKLLFLFENNEKYFEIRNFNIKDSKKFTIEKFIKNIDKLYVSILRGD